MATYTYDALNRRIGADVNGTQTWTVYDGQNPYADFTPGGSGGAVLSERYLYGPAVDEILARTSSGGTTAWYLTDHEGSVRDIVNTSGNELDHLVIRQLRECALGEQSVERGPVQVRGDAVRLGHGLVLRQRAVL